MIYRIWIVYLAIREQDYLASMLDWALEHPPVFECRQHAEWIANLNEKYGL